MTETSSNPRADHKAAKAYAKATRPWYKKKRWIIAIVLLIIIIASAAGSGGGGGGDDDKADTSAGVTDTARTDTKSSDDSKKSDSKNSGDESEAKPSAFGSNKLPLQNGDWRLDSINVKDDGLGSFGASARITYTGDDKEGGTNIFTVTIFKGEEMVGTLMGSANTVLPGKTVTAQFISQDSYVAGDYKYDFQNDL